MWLPISERRFLNVDLFIRPDIEMLGRLIQERDSVVVGKRGSLMHTLFCILNRESVGVPEDAVHSG